MRGVCWLLTELPEAALPAYSLHVLVYCVPETLILVCDRGRGTNQRELLQRDGARRYCVCWRGTGVAVDPQRRECAGLCVQAVSLEVCSRCLGFWGCTAA